MRDPTCPSRRQPPLGCHGAAEDADTAHGGHCGVVTVSVVLSSITILTASTPAAGEAVRLASLAVATLRNVIIELGRRDRSPVPSWRLDTAQVSSGLVSWLLTERPMWAMVVLVADVLA